MSEPVSIRANNPGAMWGSNKRAAKWGATADLVLHDGQSNHIAVFPTKVQGAAAQFDLWRGGYTGMTLVDAIRKWSGGNSSAAYETFLEAHTGICADDVLTPELLAGPKGLALMKAQAQWEAGKPYPMTAAEWAQAQAMVFRGAQHAPVPSPRPRPDDEGASPARTDRPEPPRKPAVRSTTIWAQVATVLTALGGALTDWRALAVIVVAALAAYVIWERLKRPDISGVFK